MVATARTFIGEMMGLVKLNKAITFQFEPGDGTRYTCVFSSWSEHDIYLAIGSGQGISVANSIAKRSVFEFAKDLKQYCKNANEHTTTGQMITQLRDHHLARWWVGQQLYNRNANPWTVVAGLLVAIFCMYADAKDGDERAISDGITWMRLLYSGQYDQAYKTLESWGI